MTARDLLFSLLVGILAFAVALGITGVVLIQLDVGALAGRPELENWAVPGADILPVALAIAGLPGGVAFAIACSMSLRARVPMSVVDARIEETPRHAETLDLVE